MKLKINIEKSIEKEKLCPKYSYYLDYFMYGFFTLAFFIIIIGLLSESNFHVSLTMTIGILIYIVLSTFTFYILGKMTKLTVLNIKDKTKARQFIHDLTITESDWKIWKEEADIIIFQTNPGFSNERQVTFIIRNGNLFINVMSFGRDMMSPIYYLSDKDILKTIIDKLKENKIVQYDFS
ncbi:MAG: hypothetical protein PHS84_03320 [Paludibacter sp.]|jgi:hypothetical protein|nr:hypothetical protein [Paludibacter sp.]